MRDDLEGYRDIEFNPTDTTLLNRYLRILRLLASECDQWGHTTENSLLKRRSLLRIRIIVGRKPEAESAMRNLISMGAVVEHKVVSKTGCLLFTYFDITEVGRDFQRRLSETLLASTILIRDAQRAVSYDSRGIQPLSK